jgi:Adenine-specific DNA methylase containing a Zn-ribbon
MTDRRLIEAGFPCHQVGAETARERGASSALPPLYFLHVWWARRPLTPSRAAIAGSLAPFDTSVSEFVRSLGIEQKCALVGGDEWVLTGDILDFIERSSDAEYLEVDSKVISRFHKEVKRRETDREAIVKLKEKLDEEHRNSDLIEKMGKSRQALLHRHLERG